MKLDVEVEARGTIADLAGMRGRVESRSLLEILARDLEDYETEVFATRGFGSWPADDADTLEQKSGARVLVDTGGLLRQLTYAQIGGDSVQVDEGSAFYARFLRDGDRGMPRRDPAPRPTRRHVERWADHLVRYIVEGTR